MLGKLLIIFLHLALFGCASFKQSDTIDNNVVKELKSRFQKGDRYVG